MLGDETENVAPGNVWLFSAEAHFHFLLRLQSRGKEFCTLGGRAAALPRWVVFFALFLILKKNLNMADNIGHIEVF